MNTIFKLIMYSIMLNFAAGLMMNILPDIGNNPIYNPNLNNPDMNNAAFISGLNSSISPTPDQSNTFFRLIDSLNIGIIAKFLATLNNYLYGFLNFIDLMFKISSMNIATNGINGSAIMFTLKSALTISYIVGAIWLWTGKNLTQ